MDILYRRRNLLTFEMMDMDFDNKTTIRPRMEITYLSEQDACVGEYRVCHGEYRVSITDGRFSGKTKIYTDYQYLVDMGESLLKFPEKVDDIFEHSNGEFDGYAYWYIKLYTTDKSGHTAITCDIEDGFSCTKTPFQRNRLKITFMVEPASIEKFAKELINLGEKKVESATLIGKQ